MRLLSTIALALTAVLAFSGASPAARHADGCCVEAQLTATWSAASHQLTYTFTSPAGFEASSVVVGSTLAGSGKVVMESWANVPSTSGHWGSTGGTYTTYLDPRPSKDFYVQVDFACVMVPVSGCSGLTDAIRHAFSNPALVRIGATGGKTGGETKGSTVTFSRTVTITHADGRTEQTKQTVLVDGDVVKSYGDPVKITLKDGKVAIDRQTQIRYKPYRWELQRGAVWYSGPETTVAGQFAAVVPAVGRTTFTVSRGAAADTVRYYAGKYGLGVWTLGRTAMRSLRAGQEVKVKAGRTFSPVTTFKTTARPFWR